MSGGSDQTRRYGGVPTDERRKRRREQILEAGLQIFGTTGYRTSTVRSICQQAGVNQRYFYESFDTREDLLEAVYSRIVRELAGAAFREASEAEDMESRVRAALTAWWTIVAGDHRKARILTIEFIGVNDRLEERRLFVRRQTVNFVIARAALRVGASEEHVERHRVQLILIARSLIGGVVELLLDHLNGQLEGVTVEDLVEHCVGLFMAAGRAAFRELGAGSHADDLLV